MLDEVVGKGDRIDFNPTAMPLATSFAGIAHKCRSFQAEAHSPAITILVRSTISEHC